VGEQHTSLKAVFSLSDSILTIEWADIHRTLTPHDSRREQTRKQLTTAANLELTRNYNQLQVIVLIAKRRLEPGIVPVVAKNNTAVMSSIIERDVCERIGISIILSIDVAESDLAGLAFLL
jgi:hypothetical protein